MAAKRTRGQLAQFQRELVEAAATDTSPDPDFPGLDFVSSTQKGKFLLFKNRPLLPTRFICRHSMRNLGLDSETEALFKGVGMKGMYNLQERTFPRLTWEFLSSLKVEKVRATGMVATISFRLMNISYAFNLGRLASIFGLDDCEEHSPPDHIHYSKIWLAISGLEDQVGVKRPATACHNAPMRIWQRYMGCTVFSRDEPWTFRVDELEILGSYLRTKPKNYKINIAHHLALHLQKLANAPGQKVPIHCGGLITKIARSIGVRFDFNSNDYVPGEIYLSKEYMRKKLEWIVFNPADNHDYWQINKKNSIPLPNPKKMKIKPDLDFYLLEVEEETGGLPPRTFGRDQTAETSSSLRYTNPNPAFPQNWTFTSGEGSGSQTSYPPLHPDITRWMEGMSLKADEAKEDHRVMGRKLDRIYYDQGAGMYPLYDEFAYRGHVPANAPHPSYHLWPDGGYNQPDGKRVYGDIHLQPDYFSAPIFPTPTPQQEEGHDAQWFGGIGPRFTGQPGTSGMMGSMMSGGDPLFGSGSGMSMGGDLMTGMMSGMMSGGVPDFGGGMMSAMGSGSMSAPGGNFGYNPDDLMQASDFGGGNDDDDGDEQES